MVLDVAHQLCQAFRLYSMIHPDEKISQLRFIRNLVWEYIQNKRSTEDPDEKIS